MRAPRPLPWLIAGLMLAGCAGAPPKRTAPEAREPVPSSPPPRPAPPAPSPAAGEDAAPRDPRRPIVSREEMRPGDPAHPELPSWWISAPEFTEGRARVATIGEAGSISEARRLATDAGRASLAAFLQREPRRVEVDRVWTARESGGRYRVYVLTVGE